MKKFILSILILTFAVSLTLGIAACVPEGLQAHTWSTSWSSNSTKHWHKCLDAGCNGRNDYEDHEWVVNEVYEEATCGEDGKGQLICSVCSATLGNEKSPATLPATGEHDWELISVDVEPTCGTEGYGSYVCSVCYDYTLLPIEATGEHDYSGNYVTTKEGHYHVCLNGCGVDEEVEPHTAGEGKRTEPTGNKDGKIEYRCTECNYLIDSEVIYNPNVLHHFTVKFVRGGGSSQIDCIPELGDDGELYVTLNTSTNAIGGYRLEFEGFTVEDKPISVGNVSLYHYNENTTKKTILNLQNGESEATGYMGYLQGQFYITRSTNDVSLWIESTISGRDPVYVKVHIKAV